MQLAHIPVLVDRTVEKRVSAAGVLETSLSAARF